MRIFQKCQNSEDIFSIPDFPLKIMYTLATFTIERIFAFINKMNKTCYRYDTFDIKTLESEQSENKPNEYYLKIVRCYFKSGNFLECEKIVFNRPKLKKDSVRDILNSYRPLDNTSFLSQAMEYACLEQLLKHFKNFDCLPQVQFA